MSDVKALLAQASFTSLHRAWLPARDNALLTRLSALKLDRDVNVLLLNATLGLQLYPSIVDFFVRLRKVQPRITVTSASYFTEVFQLGPEVKHKGLPVVSVDQLNAWTPAELDRFDVILAIGPSQALSRLMEIPGLRPKLVMLDLAFFHQLIAADEQAFFRGRAADDRRGAQVNRVAVYSCQPESKIRADIGWAYALEKFDWNWFEYIPIGFTYAPYVRSDRSLFDVALLGTAGRDYGQIEPAAFTGLRLLFLGNPDGAPELARLQTELDITVVSRVKEDDYSRVLALARCVVLPLGPMKENVLLSVVDTLGSGLPLVATRRPGYARMERDGAPIALYDRPAEIGPIVRALLDDEAHRRGVCERAVGYARERLDMYRILETIVREQVI